MLTFLTAALALALVSFSPVKETKDSVMRLHRHSLGGVDALLALRRAKVVYSLTVDGKPVGTQTNTYGEGGAFRYVVEGERWRSASFDGRLAYLISPSTRRVRSYHGPDGGPMDIYFFNMLRARALLFPLMDSERTLGASLTLLPRKRDNDPFVLTATYPDGQKRVFTVDASGRLVRDAFRIEGRGLNLDFRTDYLDYRMVRRALLPGRISISIRGTIDAGGFVRPIDRAEVLALKEAVRGVRVDADFIVPGRPLTPVEGTEVELENGLRFRYSGSVPVGDDPESIRAADLNGDGSIDLVTGDDGGISFLPGGGDGGFPSRLALPGGGGSNEYALPLDADGDGVLDLAVASTAKPSKTMFLSLGLGRGRFSQPRAFGVGDFPEAIAAADFDGDGNLDVALAHNRSGDARVLFGDGKGSFGRPVVLKLSGRGENLVAADLNNDGLPDLLVVDQKKLFVFINSGGGKFEAGEEYDAGPFPFCVAAADFDGDGLTDVLVGNGGIFADYGERDLALLPGNGDGSLKPAAFISAGGGISSIALADFDGDGFTDAAAASFGTHECLILRNSGGTLTPAGALACGWSPAAVTSADFNGDGAPDLAVANEYGDDVSIWLGVPREDDRSGKARD